MNGRKGEPCSGSLCAGRWRCSSRNLWPGCCDPGRRLLSERRVTIPRHLAFAWQHAHQLFHVRGGTVPPPHARPAPGDVELDRCEIEGTLDRALDVADALDLSERHPLGEPAHPARYRDGAGSVPAGGEEVVAEGCPNHGRASAEASSSTW